MLSSRFKRSYLDIYRPDLKKTEIPYKETLEDYKTLGEKLKQIRKDF